MSTGKGYASRCAIGIETVFGTAVVATELIPFTSESINKTIAIIESGYLDGDPGRKQIKNGAYSVSGDLSGELIYDEISGTPIGIERLIKGVLGGSARDATNGLNKYYSVADIDDHFTFAFDKQVSCWENISVKINSLELSGTIGEQSTFTAGGLIGQNLLRTGDAGIVNDSASIQALSPTIPTPIIMEDSVFRIGDIADALTSTDEMCIEGFTLSVNNNLSDAQYATECVNNADPFTSLEPIRNGRREVNFNVTIPRYESDVLFGYQQNDTVLQADLKFAIGSYEFNILLPYIKVDSPSAPISGPEMIKHEVAFTCLRNAGRNTYMAFQDATAISNEIGIECKTARTTAA